MKKAVNVLVTLLVLGISVSAMGIDLEQSKEIRNLSFISAHSAQSFEI